MKLNALIAAGMVFFTGCVMPTPTPAPTFGAATPAQEKEYTPYLAKGTAILKGQAFMTTRGGDVKKAAGRPVWLDPVTSYSQDWFARAGSTYLWRELVPMCKAFTDARRQTVADADGRFEFADLPAGTYYVRTTVTWEVATLGTQGGLIVETVTLASGETKPLIMHR